MVARRLVETLCVGASLCRKTAKRRCVFYAFVSKGLRDYSRLTVSVHRKCRDAELACRRGLTLYLTKRDVNAPRGFASIRNRAAYSDYPHTYCGGLVAGPPSSLLPAKTFLPSGSIQTLALTVLDPSFARKPSTEIA